MKEKLSAVLTWIKNNKLASVLIAILVYILLFAGKSSRPFSLVEPMIGTDMEDAVYEMGSAPRSMIKTSNMALPATGGVAPQPSITTRRVITQSYLSLKVKSVRDTIEIIKGSTTELGGYMVDMDLSSPEMGETGSIAIRIPTDQLEEALKRFRTLAVKVVSENISGNDITDEYVDIETRLERLEATKARFEEILDKAVTVEDILQVQNQIFYVQDQIDSYKGQLEYMENASSTTLIRVYLSTDELSLPYTPEQGWRPGVVFKQATRHMISTLVKIGNFGIWVVVYTPIAIVGLILFFVFRKWMKRNNL